MSETESTPKVRIVTVDAHHDGQRVDNFLASLLKGVPRSAIYRVVRRGEVRVNKGRVKPDHRLRQGDAVRVPPVRVAESGSATVPDGVCQRLAAAVLYEDADVLVLDKPSGLAVHGGSGLAFGIIEALRQLRPNAPFLELVHRLDRETSGCLLLAKSRPALLKLQEDLQSGAFTKRYLALVKGAWPQHAQSVAVPLRKNAVSGGERVVVVSDDGREARTDFKVVHAYGQTTLVEAALHTGRTHQIRVHAAHLGCPLAGDGKYGDAAFNKQLRTAGLKRLFLHASELGFPHPRTGAFTVVRSPLPDELASFVKLQENT